MKRRQRRNNLIAGIAGALVVVIVSLALNFWMSSRGQAQGESPILPTLTFPPTPTIPPSPTPMPILSSTILAAPEFQNDDSLKLWEFVDVGAILPEDKSVWRVVDGTLLQDNTAMVGSPSSTNEAMAFIGSPTWTNYTVSARFYDQGNGNVGLVARRQGDSFYRLRILAQFYNETPRMVLEKVIDGKATALATLDGPSYDFHAWYDIALKVDGTSIQAFVNGKPLLEATDDALSSGQAGLFTRAMGKLRFSDVVVTGL
ncbi:DUF1080 domain-containing protein [Oscillochloris sp. ZM17-4]|uniref:family 16 glycoside hydrolase n=1 Tax=Oscillochloris sp. ZM17-4 TaxID=2866714 RepID=UPI001C730299|nr:family 16 glycoside hydrolase [Oscillochloris sp. ZM17-4]MBX0326699.1 DUF1080 domain-containing protein [Oscillochloris sp. ZM17-4]